MMNKTEVIARQALKIEKLELALEEKLTVEKRLEKIGLLSYGSQATSLTVQWDWVYEESIAVYKATVKLYLWLENGRMLPIEGSTIESVLRQAEDVILANVDQALKIENAKQWAGYAHHKQNTLTVEAGLKLCDRNADQAGDLTVGQIVRVNHSGDAHEPILLAKITKMEQTSGHKLSIHVELEGIATYAGVVNLTKEPFSNMLTRTAKVIEIQ